MPLVVQCPNPACGVSSSVGEAVSGRNVKCKKCGTPFIAKPTFDGEMTDTKKSHPASTGKLFSALPANFGRYRVLKLLGQGGMGAVYLAEDSQLGRQVALKMPNFDAAESPQRVERFVREARSAAVLHHPNICTVFDAGQIEGRPFITMAFIAGRTLEAILDSDDLMPQHQAAEIIRKVALGLAHAHGKGTVHRDLKPANVMIAEDGEPVVTDFGLAKRVADVDPSEVKLTRLGGIVGTPSYMSPEQVRGEGIGSATDIYSLGVMLFEMLTGKTPYNGSMGVVMGQILSAPVPPVREFRPDVDSRLDALCRKAMAKDPAGRFSSMVEFANALGRYQEAPTATPPPLPLTVTVEVERIPSPMVDHSPFGDLEDLPTPAPISKKRKKGRGKLSALALALLVPLVIGVAAVVFRMETPNGTLIVEMNDDAVETRIKGGKLILTGPDGKVRYTLTASDRNKKLKAGAYTIGVEGADGLVLDTPEFTLKKGGVVTVRVRMEGKRVVKKEEPGKEEPREPSSKWVSLFNGKDLTGWVALDSKPAEWVVEDGHIEVTSGKQDIMTKEDFGPNFELHVEFWLPLMADKKGQGRANSGVFLQSRYEIQILDSYMNDTAPTGSVGAMYGIIAPDKEAQKKAVRKPETWNTLDITFYSPRVDEKGKMTEPGRITVVHNDVVTIDDATFDKVTAGAIDEQVGVPGPIRLQNHRNNPVRFRNIKIKELKLIPGLDPDRKAAEYVLSIGGVVRVNDEVDDIRAVADLPKEAFRLTYVDASRNPKLRNAGLAAFEGCRNLKFLSLYGTQLKDLGLSYFKECKNLETFHASDTQVSDAGLAHLAGCNGLTLLNLGDTQVSDAGLAAFKGCNNLKILNLGRTKVRGEGLVHFKDAKNLTFLSLWNTPVRDTDLAHFKDCKNLLELNLDCAGVADVGVAHFKGCKKLVVLQLEETQVTDEGMAHFSGCTNLIALGLAHTKVGDVGLAHFKDCKKLKKLRLHGTRMTDVGLAYFKGCETMEICENRGSKVTRAGVDDFRKVFPKCLIDIPPR